MDWTLYLIPFILGYTKNQIIRPIKKKKKTVQSTEMVSEKGQFLILVSDAKKRVRHGLMAAAEQDLFA